ncbi:hypothetical protein [Ralstonia mannitolilytica]|jgi:hypothetical protein|uniref:Uncharacterized protein n=1 Tax=Ralstonia mannitolilytica TaxID=105219 RepID=A0AAD2EI01_9RALS|nr:hypothetical protein [Ralstonia mannitolilytica]ATG19542.1 hypothetical protein CO705_06510 [Ralstonia pickettii]ANA32322.1 hypothetical protein VZ52_02325 [Ralstonia mannitolilytica]MBY4719055.1 hypothetical protein [Ralstonia mannitolilytica]CAJ0680257.1 hypothetical protein R77591_00747 [Ralstonia mannitolilytica]CAJ0680295.1 hypothetical protein R82526_00644 [Ralstonia mannitolilytica]
MNKFIVGACAGVLSLAASQYATAQTSTTAKPAAKKKAPAKKAAKKAAPVAAAVQPEGVQWKCELGNDLYIKGDMARDQIITMHWKGKNYQLPRQMTRTGADRYFDQKTGMDLVVIPSKAMLFDRNEGHRLADECQTAEMAAGAPAPTQAGALRAPAGLPLMMQDSAAPAPAPAPAPEGAQPAKQ